MHLHTHVNGYCISTVGELIIDPNGTEFETIGCERLYETMVFKETADGDIECNELDFEGYNDLRAAEEGHMDMCRKWEARQ